MVETIEFDFTKDLNAPQFLELQSELSPPVESKIEAGEAVKEAEAVVEESEVVEVQEKEDASSESKP